MTTDIAGLIVRAGGEIAGKVRLQKTFYLLDQLGMNSGYSFEYHHYGPYSADLAEQVADDIVFDRVRAEAKHRRSDGVPYVVYEALGPGEGTPPDTEMDAERLDGALNLFSNVSATVLELAATIHWLAVVERLPDWREELVKRKGSKTSGGRTEEALGLLRDLKLPPAVQAALE